MQAYITESINEFCKGTFSMCIYTREKSRKPSFGAKSRPLVIILVENIK